MEFHSSFVYLRIQNITWFLYEKTIKNSGKLFYGKIILSKNSSAQWGKTPHWNTSNR